MLFSVPADTGTGTLDRININRSAETLVISDVQNAGGPEDFIIQENGTLNVSAGGVLNIGFLRQQNTGSSTLQISGGAVNFNATKGDSVRFANQSGGGQQSHILMQSGTFTANARIVLAYGSTTELQQTGGTFNTSSQELALANSLGTVFNATISGGTFLTSGWVLTGGSSNQLHLTVDGYSQGQINLGNLSTVGGGSGSEVDLTFKLMDSGWNTKIWIGSWDLTNASAGSEITVDFAGYSGLYVGQVITLAKLNVGSTVPFFGAQVRFVSITPGVTFVNASDSNGLKIQIQTVPWLPSTPSYSANFATSIDTELPAALSLSLPNNISYERWACATLNRTLEVYQSPDQGLLTNPSTTLSQATTLGQKVIKQIYTDLLVNGSNPIKDFSMASFYSRGVQALKTVNPTALQASFSYNGSSITYEQAFRSTMKNWIQFFRGYEPDPTQPTAVYGNQRETDRVVMFVVNAMYPTDTDTDFVYARTYAKAYWQKFINVIKEDAYETSGNYTFVGLSGILTISDVLGNTSPYDLTRNIGSTDFPALSYAFYDVVARNAALVSPSGFRPEFGDDYFSLQITPQAYLHDDTDWIYILERTSGMFGNDPALLYAARKLGARMVNNSGACILPRWTNSNASLPVGYLPSELTQSSIRISYDAEPSPALGGASVTEIEKMVLRSSNEPGSPMVMIDLNKGGQHTHPTARGQVGYYEVNGAPLFYNYGRYIQQDYNANKVVFRPSGEAFPFVNGTITPPQADGLVHTVQTPTSLFLYREYDVAADNSASTQFYVTGKTIAGNAVAGASYTINNLRKVDRNGVATTLSLPFTGSAYDYPAILSDVQMSGYSTVSQPQVRWIGGAGTSAGSVPNEVYQNHIYDTWHYMQWQPWETLDTGTSGGIAKTRVETRDGDNCAILTFSAYGTFDSTLTRQVVMTREGILVIVDNIHVGASAAGMTAAALWQIYTLSSSHGSDWYAETGEFNHLNIQNPSLTDNAGFVVKFRANDTATTMGVASIPNGRINNNNVVAPNNTTNTQFAAFSKKTLLAGSTVCFTTVVVPTPPEAQTNFNAVASKVSWGTPSLGYADAIISADASNPFTTGAVRIKTAPYGTWTVTRTP